MKAAAIGWLIGLGVIVYAGRNQIRSLAVSQKTALSNPNVQAFLAMIEHFESRGQFNVLYHPSHNDPYYDPNAPLFFTDYSTHPNIRIHFLDPRTGKENYSTAAGAFQITHPTWWALSKLPGAPSDFSPAAQQWYAVALLKENGALEAIMQGDFQTAIKLASRTWASLPYTTSGQVHVSYNTALQIYSDNGGSYA